MLQHIILMFLHITVPILFVLNAKMWQCQVWKTRSRFMTQLQHLSAILRWTPWIFTDEIPVGGSRRLQPWFSTPRCHSPIPQSLALHPWTLDGRLLHAARWWEVAEWFLKMCIRGWCNRASYLVSYPLHADFGMLLGSCR